MKQSMEVENVSTAAPVLPITKCKNT